MVKMYTVVWTSLALTQLEKAYKYVRKDVLQNAEKVKKMIS